MLFWSHMFLISVFFGGSEFSQYFSSWIILNLQGGREVTVHPDNMHFRLNISLHCTAQHAVQCKMVGWQQCAR
jgi:hypothetical protein